MEAEQTSYLQNNGVQPTDDSAKYIWRQPCASIVKAIYSSTEFVDKYADDGLVGIVLEATSFYAEAGGQTFDTGKITGDGFEFSVEDCQSFAGFVVHIGHIVSGSVSIGSKVESHVDYDRRVRVAPNHTMTHVLNFALRKVLGEHVSQKGSLVDSSKLRFDFSNPKPLKPAQLEEVERICTEQINASYEVFTMPVALEKAREICSLRAVFGEVYPDPVRVVSVGHPILPMLENPKDEKWFNYSVEFCGGTHLANTSEARRIAITSEVGIATGIRRIVAVTLDAAEKAFAHGDSIMSKLEALASQDPLVIGGQMAAIRTAITECSADIPSSSKAALSKRMDELMSIHNKAKKKAAQESIKRSAEELKVAIEMANENNEKFVVLKVSGSVDGKALRGALIKSLQAFDGTIVLFGVDVSGDKVLAFAGASSAALESGVDAVKCLGEPLSLLGGKAGGKPALAQGKGSAVDRIDEAVALARECVVKQLK